MVTAVILQPHYIPYCGFFKLIETADIFVIFDNVQFQTRSWQHRNKIKTPDGFKWLSVPVIKNSGQKIQDVKIQNTVNWQKKHWSSIIHSYSKSKYFKDYKDFFQDVYSKKWHSIVDLNIHIINFLIEELGFSTKFIKASELDVSGKKSELLINICKKIGATHYHSNMGSKTYMDQEMHLFDDAEIRVSYMEYKHPIYTQLFGEFTEYMSVLDVLFNHGKESKRIILGEVNS